MSDPLAFSCPHCNQPYRVTPEQVPQYAGQTIQCSVCQRTFTVSPNLGQGAPSGYAQGAAISYASQLPQETNGQAIASLVLGISGFCVPVIPPILAIVFGIFGLKKTRDPRVGGRGLAIAGIICGALSLVIGIGLLLMQFAILVPAMSTARDRAMRVQCASNLKQIGMAMQLYANDHKTYPADFRPLVNGGYLNLQAFVCPRSGDTAAPNAGALTAGGHLSYVYVPVRQGMSAPVNAVVAYEPLSNHGGQGGNFLFNDGHVEWINGAVATTAIAELGRGMNPPPALSGPRNVPPSPRRPQGAPVPLEEDDQ